MRISLRWSRASKKGLKRKRQEKEEKDEIYIGFFRGRRRRIGR
jgi:hypothetical protein